jgi:integrase
VLITDVINDYAEEVGPTMAMPERIGYALTPLAKFWTGKALSDVRPESCRAYGKWRVRSDGTIRRELGILRTAINHAFAEGRITRPVPVKLPPSPPSRERWLTRHEVAKLLNAARTSTKASLHLPLFILIALRCGKRKEAILSLRWSQIDLQRKVIDWERPGAQITKKRRGRNPIPDRLLPYLVRARRRGSETGYVIQFNGRPVKDIKKAFAAACDRAGIEDASPHVLRHTCATWLMQNGVEQWQAAGFLGMTTETLQKTYGHHHPDFQSAAANAF